MDLVQQRVAARSGERGVELVVELAELLELLGVGRAAISAISARCSSVARLVAISTIAGSMTWRTSNSCVHERLAVVAGEVDVGQALGDDATGCRDARRTRR